MGGICSRPFCFGEPYMEMMKLKVATKRMAGYTGVLGPVRFTDGVSDEFLPRHIRDRMAASMEFLEVDAEGNEQPAGAQHRLIREAKERAPKLEPLKRQTEEEKAAEIAAAAVLTAKVPVLETRQSLEAIASKDGIKGLREIGRKWGVKHRSIPTLIEMILDAQEKSIAARNKKLADKAAAEAEKLKTTAPAAEDPGANENQDDADAGSTIDPVVAAEAERLATENAAEAKAFLEQQALKAAAATGDLAAAVSAEPASQE